MRINDGFGEFGVVWVGGELKGSLCQENHWLMKNSIDNYCGWTIRLALGVWRVVEGLGVVKRIDRGGRDWWWGMGMVLCRP